MGIRFPVWGPLEHIDAVGLDLGYSVQNTVLPEISDSKKPAEGLKAHVERGELGFKTGSGYYDWNQKSMEELAKTRNDFIVHALKFMKLRGLI
jgi:3-hydroxybutyryl-CoA dehydrogenase